MGLDCFTQKRYATTDFSVLFLLIIQLAKFLSGKIFWEPNLSPVMNFESQIVPLLTNQRPAISSWTNHKFSVVGGWVVHSEFSVQPHPKLNKNLVNIIWNYSVLFVKIFSFFILKNTIRQNIRFSLIIKRIFCLICKCHNLQIDYSELTK